MAGTASSAVVPVSLLADVQRNVVLLLAPFAPYLAHELWETLGEKTSLLRTPWPKYDPALAKEEEIEIPVQINGKLRSRIVVPVDTSEDVMRERALADEKIRAAIAGKQVVKVIVVPGKLELFSNADGTRWSARPTTILVDSTQLDSGEAMSAEFKAAAVRIDKIDNGVSAA